MQDFCNNGSNGHAVISEGKLDYANGVDLISYREELSDLGFSEQQEREFLETLQSIMAAFVEMGFSADVCGLIFGEFNESSGASVADGKLISSPPMETPSPSDEEETAP